MSTTDQSRSPLDGVAVADVLVELKLLLSNIADDEWNAGLRTAAQASIAAIRKLQDLAPCMERLFQTFAGGWHGHELQEAISEVWKEWSR